jgi:adenylate cyclase
MGRCFSQEVTLAFIVIIEPVKGEPREFRLVEGETPIGRDPANALVLEGRGVSRRHAKFILSGNRLTLVDLGSTYGTRVNDVAMLRRDLIAGDEITVGMNRLKIKTASDKVSAAIQTLTSSEIVSDFEVEETTGSPADVLSPEGSFSKRPTVEMNRQAIQFVADTTPEQPAIKILRRHDSDLMKAMRRIGETKVSLKPPAAKTIVPESADYQALVLMFKVSELLAAATDLEDFVSPMADLVLEEVKANTVVLLMLGEKEELLPRVIRYKGALHKGEIPVSRSIIDRVLRDKVAVMSNDLGRDEKIPLTQSVMLYKIRAAVALPLLVVGELRGILYISRSIQKAFTAAENDLMTALAALIASGLERAELKEKVVREKQRRKALERFHPPEVVDKIFSGEEVKSSLDEYTTTVLVCELQGFAGLVQKVPPRQLASVLNEYYELLYEHIFANGGSLVKFHDSLALALFGFLHTPDKDAVWAIEAAIELCREFSSIAVLWPEFQSLSLCCALDTGTVVAGVIGSADRMVYTAIGQPITTASTMLQQASGTCILASERTIAEIPQTHYRFDEMAPLSDLKLFRVMWSER